MTTYNSQQIQPFPQEMSQEIQQEKSQEMSQGIALAPTTPTPAAPQHHGPQELLTPDPDKPHKQPQLPNPLTSPCPHNSPSNTVTPPNPIKSLPPQPPPLFPRILTPKYLTHPLHLSQMLRNKERQIERILAARTGKWIKWPRD